MIKIHKLEDGDIIKFIPRIVDGKIEWAKKVDMLAGLETGNGYHSVVAFDTECKWAYKIIHQSNFSNGRKATKSTRYYFNTLTTKGEIKSIAVSRSLMKIIMDNKQLLDLKSNWQLNIKMEVRNSYPIFDKSHPIECDWNCPVDINSGDEWKKFITKNQPDLETYFKQNDIYSKRSELIQYFGSDVIGQIITEDRGKKLNELGI